MYLCGPEKHNCQPFCGPEGRFYCSDSVCSLWPAPFSYLCVSVMILGVLKTVCGWTSKNWLLPYACCGLHFIDSAACVLSFDHSTPLHIYLSLHCHHQYDSCIKMGSEESHFNVSLTVRNKVTRQCPQTTPLFWRERRAEAVLNRGPSAYHPTALPLGQTGSHNVHINHKAYLGPGAQDGHLDFHTAPELWGDKFSVALRPHRP